eukprot:TRINITY_DN2097_c0_g1_i2.p1 TRINITY_DN2097_c0_g1~~TRINITY_DN2097_c0_g1_i2.p1  ORF type:complete len:357 (+),score=69.06 TRINITY_DN2097_c0_g1_i2:30-1073(+)
MTVDEDPLSSSHYDTLKLHHSASMKDIRSAYMREARLHHPDRRGNSSSFVRVQKAYEVLGDDSQRATYDKRLTSKKTKKEPLRHLTPRLPVLSPFVVLCSDRAVRTVDVHETRFGLALRHGDVIETQSGVMGMVVGMFDGDVYWLPSGLSQAECLGYADDLRNPGVGGVTWRKLQSGARSRTRSVTRQASSRGSSLVRRLKKTPQERSEVARQNLVSAERVARDSLERHLWEQQSEVLIKCQSELEIVDVKRGRKPSRLSYNAFQINSRSQSRPVAPSLRRASSLSFHKPSPSPSVASCGTPATPRPRVAPTRKLNSYLKRMEPAPLKRKGSARTPTTPTPCKMRHL